MLVARSLRVLCMATPFLALAAAAPRPAEACSCAPQSPFVTPEPGATNVPRNAIVAVLVYGGTSPEALQIQEAATGASIAVDVEVMDHAAGYVTRLLIARPREPLAPATEYRITIGEQATFTTGDALDIDAPVFAGLSALKADTTAYDGDSGCFSTCIEPMNERVQAIELSFPDPGSDVAFMTLALRREGEASPFTMAPLRRREGGFVSSLGFHLCDPVLSPSLEPGQVYCGRLTAYDAAGNTAGEGPEICATASTCATNLVDPECWPEDTSCDGHGLPGCVVQAGQPGGWPAALIAALACLMMLDRRARRRR